MDSLRKSVIRKSLNLLRPVLAKPVSRIARFYGSASVDDAPGMPASPFDTPTGRIATAFVLASGPDAWFPCRFNGIKVWIPRDTLRTMVHCVHAGSDGELIVQVETGHLEWMMSRLERGGTFVDVGAATGATTIPVAAKFGSSVSIVAFEPAIAARRLLTETLERNNLLGVVIIPKAVSSTSGTVTFAEYSFDETGAIPFLPEKSAILAQNIDRSKARTYEVPVTTLDEVDLPSKPPVVIKIDVEGFEIEVLKGASHFILKHRPFFSIDIHPLPSGGEMTEGGVREVLGRYKYGFSRLGHVLLCEPL